MNRIRMALAATLAVSLVAACAPAGTPTPVPATPAPTAAVDIEQACPSPEADRAATPVDTSRFETADPGVLGVSAGYLANAWIAFNNAYVNYAATEDQQFTSITVSDAGFDVSKQVSDIEDLITRRVIGIIYWPIDNGALATVLQSAEAAGIPTVNVGNGFSDQPGITSNAQIDNYVLGRNVAVQLVEELGGSGRIVSVIPIAGTPAATQQDAALRCVLEQYPGIELLDTQHGDWDTAKSKTITEAWLQRFAQIDGVYSPSGQMSLGVAEAFEEAGRLDEVTFSPGDEYNGWLKWIRENPDKNTGIVTFPVSIGARSVELMSSILDGEEVPLGIWTGAEYVGPEEAAAMAIPDRPDDWWPNELPSEFLP
jgi:ribose transport system substrate-binding protein